jgi:hypothetical protein
MSFLAPLYLLAGLAISLPILFHLIRQTPRGRQVFSSVMFLAPSPPRVTRRSRIEHWLLLLLRALAICLIAAAFARPFLRAQEQVPLESDQGRRIAILIDTSASMRRDGYWEAARERLREVAEQLRPGDAVAAYSFDRSLSPLISFQEWNELPPDARATTLLERTGQLTPTWFSTHLGEAMIEVAEELDDLLAEDGTDSVTAEGTAVRKTSERTLIVISDLQAGSDWAPLNGFPWPENVAVQLERVGDRDDATNASLQVVSGETPLDEQLRVRVSNSANARKEQFRIQWSDEFPAPSEGETAGISAVRVYVPPGQSRVVRAPERRGSRGQGAGGREQGAEETQGALGTQGTQEIEGRGSLSPSPRPPVPPLPDSSLLITGDDEEFDNICYVARRPVWNVQVVYFGERDETTTHDLRFFLDPLFPSTPMRRVGIIDWSQDAPDPETDGREPTLLILTGELNPSQREWARTWAKGGGPVLFVSRDPQQGAELYDLLGLAPAEVGEADEEGYAMVQRADLSHPVLSQFDDPRFSDFSKLRVWKHRIYDPGSVPEMRVLLGLDDGSPLLAEIPWGEGRIFLLTAGWNRDDSELAVWSKFVPLMNRMLEYGAGRQTVRPQFFVGDEVRIRDLGLDAEEAVIRAPRGELFDLSGDESLLLDRPGIYRVATTEERLEEETAGLFAVNLDPQESATEPLPVELLEAAGVRLLHQDRVSREAMALADADQQRQLMNRELESRQQIWKWLIASALGVLLLETLVAGRLSRRRTTEESAASG